MSSKSLFTVVGLAAIAGSVALAQPAKDAKPAQPAKPAAPAKDAKPAAGQPEHGMPGMSEQQQKDMQMCMEAATPGPQHAHLAKGVGTWNGKCKMWMAPDSEAMTMDCTSTVTSLMDGRFFKVEVTGSMMGMPFTGSGINGYDNVSQKFVSTWFDNFGTGMMTGTGEQSADGKVLTWKYNFNCPITKKPIVMRQVETQTGPNSFTLEMFGPEPHSGKEFKSMEISFTRAPAAKAID